MVAAPGQGPGELQGAHLVLYDGVCGLCNRLLQFLLAHDDRGVFAFASLQSTIGRSTVARFGGDPDELASFYVVANYRAPHATLFARSGAALFVAGELAWPWKAAALLRALPTGLLDPVYNLIARYRYRVFGRFDHCVIPRPEFKRRFIDVWEAVMKVVIPGGSGQVGTVLARAFHGGGHQVVILSRHDAVRPWRVVQWDGRTPGDWSREIDGCDVVINLTGRSVNCRYTAENRQEILQSRVHSTQVVGDAIARAGRSPRVWLQASTATIYAHRYDRANDEYTGVLGGGESDAPSSWRFSIDVARAWERAFEEAVCPRTRKVVLRSAMTLSPDPGGIFDTLLGLTRRGIGGTAGDGRQFMSWIHYEDFIAAVRWLIDRNDIDGAVNVASPNPLPNEEFMRVLREACGVRVGLPATKWMLEIGAAFMGTETELILKSRRVVPARLLDHGFQFKYACWPDAARNLCAKSNVGLAA